MSPKFFNCIIITIVLFGYLLFGMLGCAGTASTAAPSGATSTPIELTGIQAGDIVVTSSVAEGHTHQVVIKYYDLISPPIYDVFTTTEAGAVVHKHTVRLTKQDFEAINAGKTVKVTSSTSAEYNHMHTFTIKK